MEAQNLFANSRMNITAEGKRHLGAVIGSTEYREEHVKDLAKDQNNQLTILSTVAKTQPQAAYLAFVSGSIRGHPGSGGGQCNLWSQISRRKS